MRIAVWLLSGLLCACSGLQPQQPADFTVARAHNGSGALAFAPHADWLVSGGWEGTLKRWSLPALEAVQAWHAHRGGVTGVGVLAAGYVVSTGRDRRIAVWDPAGRLLEAVETGAPVTAFALAEAGGVALAATGTEDGAVEVWRFDPLRAVDRHRPHRGFVRSVAIERTGDGWRVASGGADGTVVVRDHRGRTMRLERPPTDAWSLAFGPEPDTLYGGGWFQLFEWDLAAGGRLRARRTEHFGIIRALLPAGPGRLYSISRQTDSAVLLIDASTGESLRRFRSQSLCGGAIVRSRDGRYLATTGDDGVIQLWVLDGRGATSETARGSASAPR